MKDKTAVMCHNIAKFNRENPMPNEMNHAECGALMDGKVIAMRLIDADKAASIENLDDYGDFALGIGDMEDVRELLNDAPTVDAVPVVRCGECTMGKRMPITGVVICQCMNGSVMSADDFCSYGERKDGEK